MANTIVLMLLTQGQGWDVEFWRVPKEIYQALKLVSFASECTELAITSNIKEGEQPRCRKLHIVMHCVAILQNQGEDILDFNID